MSYYDDCDNYNNKQLSNICYMDYDCLLKKEMKEQIISL